MAAGFNNAEIGAALGPTEGTIKNHVSSILSKLDVRDRVRAVLRALGCMPATSSPFCWSWARAGG